jgi:DNA-binding NarL/FixJ family response regulator
LQGRWLPQDINNPNGGFAVSLWDSQHDEDIRKAYEAGANAYVLKPVEFARFTDMMQQLSTFWLALVE